MTLPKYIAISVCLLLGVNSYAEIPTAYQIIAKRYGIPSEVFFAIALQESGKSGKGSSDGQRKFLPWPWTLNIDEKPFYFETREEAEAALLSAMDLAASNGKIGKVAVGLGQIYMPAHHNNFVTPIQALDPTINLDYAARYLVKHYLDTLLEGRADWWIAVGRYHSPSNEKYARQYRALVFKQCLRVSNRCYVYGESANDLTSGQVIALRE